MLGREAWLDLARELDWDPTYVAPEALYPREVSGEPWLPFAAWQSWDEPFRTSYGEYVDGQTRKQLALQAIAELLLRAERLPRSDRGWISALKLHTATFTLAEFAATKPRRTGTCAIRRAYRTTTTS